MTINDALEQIGLTQRESLIYIHLLKYGPSSPTEIATQTSIKRPNVYDAIKSLEKQGLIKYHLVSKRKLIAPEPVEKIEELVTHRLHLVQNLIPSLKSINQEGTFKSTITFYQGKRAMVNLLKEVLSMKGGELLGLWSSQDMDRILDKKTILSFIRTREKKGIKARVLHHMKKEDLKEYGEELASERDSKITQIGYVPDNALFTLSMLIYDDSVSFFSSKKESYGFKVESREYAELQRMLFENLWQNSGKLKQE